MPSRIMGSGFGKDKPNPDDLLKLGSDLAIARGTREGLIRKAVEQVDQSLAGPRSVADSLAEKLDNAIGDPIGDAKLMAEAIVRKAQAQITLHMAPAVELALRLGMRADRLPSVAARMKPRNRSRRKGRGPASDAQPGPFDEPPLPQDDPPGDPPQGFMAGPPGGVFPPGQFGAPPPAALPPLPPPNIPAPPNLASVPPDYTVMIQRGTCRVVAIPGTPDESHTAAGYVPISDAGTLQSVPPNQVQSVWQSIVASVGGCTGKPPAGAPGSGRQAGPPGGVFPPGQFNPPPQPLGGAANVQGGQLAAPPLSGPGAQPAGGSVPPAGGASAGGCPPGFVPAPFDPSQCFMPNQLVPGGSGVLTPRAVTDSSGTAPGYIMGEYPPRNAPPVAPVPPPPRPPGFMQPFPPQQPPNALGPIQWVPGPDGSLLPQLPSLPNQPPGMIGQGQAPNVPPAVGLLPLLPGIGQQPTPPVGIAQQPPILPPPPLPPGQMWPFPQSGQPGSPVGVFGDPGAAGGFPLAGPGVPVQPPPLQGSLQPGYPVPPLVPRPVPPLPIDFGPIATPPPTPGNPVPPPGVPVPPGGQPGQLPPGATPVPPPGPPCPPPVVNCPAPVVNVTVPPCPSPPPPAEPPEFQPIPPPSDIQPTKQPGKPTPGAQETPTQIGASDPAEGLPAACIPNSRIIQAVAGKDLRTLLVDAGLLTTDGQWVFTQQDLARLGNADDFWSNLRRFLVLSLDQLATGAGKSLQFLQDAISKAAGCPPTRPDGSNPDVSTAALAQVVIGFIRKWICDLPDGITRSWDYYTNWACPDALPSQAEADKAWTRGVISESTWQCWTRANGNIETTQRRVVESDYDWPTINDYYSLKRRNVLTPELLDTVRKRAGIVTAAQDIALEATTQWVASPSDAINWMLKDIADPEIVGMFDLQAEFDRKYQGIVKYVFDANGMSRDSALALWTAHWRNMAPGQLYSMLHRFRVDKTEPVQIGDKTIPAASIATTAKQVEEALGQADYPPFWRDRLMALSYSLLTRVDIRRAYEVGAINDAEFISLTRDRGYEPINAQRLLKFIRRAAVQQASRRPAANQWVTVGYDVALLKQALLDAGMREDMWDEVSRILKTRRAIYIQTKCLNQWKKEYVAKLYTETEMYQRLTSIGLPHGQAQQLLQDWQCERKATHRQVMAAALCKQRRQGIINDVALVAGLRDLGFRRRDIARMQASCIAATPAASKAVPPSAGVPVIPPEQ